MLLISYPARAVDIDVACDTADLITAINTANGNGEADTINLAAGCTYSFTAGDATNPDSALPRISTPVTIEGNGATIERAGGSTTEFRLIFVAIGSALTLSDITLTGGISSLSGGGIYSDGILTVTNSTFSGNTATYAGGGISSLGGLTVTDCNFSGNAGQSGGGIYSDGTLTVTNSTLSGNSASEGGGIYSGSTTTVTNSTISGNTAAGFGGGGGIFNSSGFGTTTVTNSTISGNTATGSGDGGGIRNSGGTMTVTNSTISDNTATGFGGEGGGIRNSGTLTVIDSTLSSNSASDGGGIQNDGTLTVINSTLSGNNADIKGGGILNVGTLTLTNSTISGNNAYSGGGGIFNGDTMTVIDSTLSSNSASNGGGIQNGGTLTVTNSTLSGNSAAAFGGGIYNQILIVPNRTLTVTNSILSGNTANNGGGGIFNSGVLTVTNSTLSGNNATTSGAGGIYNFATLTVTNSIVWGNSSQISGTVTVTYSIVEGGFTGTGNLDTDPLFVVPVPFVNAPTTAGDYRLQAGSPTLNVGSNAALPADIFDLDGDLNTAEPLPLDLDGNPRVVNVTVDMGAYEHQVAADIILSETTASVTEGGVTDSYTVKLSMAPASDVTVTPAGDDDCTVSEPLMFTTGNWADEQTVTVTAVDDAIAEGTHPCTVTNTASSSDIIYNTIVSDNVVITVTDDDPFPAELLANGDFETDADLNKVPDGWTLLNKTGDKLLCDPTKAYSGNCAFKFKGGVPESAQLSQAADLTGLTFSAGDTLSLSAWFKGASTAAKTKVILSVTYTGNPTPVKTKLTVKQHAAYTQRVVPDYTLTAGAIDQIKVVFQHKSASGSVFVDDASLIHTPGSGPRGSRSEGVLPPPLAPQGFRGGS